MGIVDSFCKDVSGEACQAVNERTGRLSSLLSRSVRSFLISRIHAPVLPSLTLPDSSIPLSHRRSCLKSGLARIVVVLRRSSCERVTLRLLFVGRMSFVSRLPQYYRMAQQTISYDFDDCRDFEPRCTLMTAILTGALQVASNLEVVPAMVAAKAAGRERDLPNDSRPVKRP